MSHPKCSNIDVTELYRPYSLNAHLAALRCASPNVAYPQYGEDPRPLLCIPLRDGPLKGKLQLLHL